MMIVELWLASGVLARGVVVLLIGMSIAAGAAAAAAWLRMRRAEGATAACMVTLAAARAAGGGALPAGEDAAIAAAHPGSPVAALMARVHEVLCQRGGGGGGELHDRLVRAQVLATGEVLRGGLGIIATVGSTAPFVGLFGTVLGIIDAFGSMGESGRGGIAVVSTGIAEALVTTALGILVAIPAVWLFNHLSQRAARILGVVERAGEELAIEGLIASGSAAAAAPVAAASERRVSWA